MKTDQRVVIIGSVVGILIAACGLELDAIPTSPRTDAGSTDQDGGDASAESPECTLDLCVDGTPHPNHPVLGDGTPCGDGGTCLSGNCSTAGVVDAGADAELDSGADSEADAGDTGDAEADAAEADAAPDDAG